MKKIMKKLILLLINLLGMVYLTYAQTNSNNMKIYFFCPRWGSESLSWDAFCEKVKKAGYDGVETGLPLDENEKKAILETLKKHNLLLICQYYQSFERDFDTHYQNYEKHLRNLAAAKPMLINSQTGKDYFTFEQNKKLIELADKISKETGIKITHETHRNKFNFAAHITKDYLEKLPNLRMTLDISHWCNVHESLLDDQPEAISLALTRSDHIHARVGHQEGPQVNDPRAPEWADALNHHLIWWDKIIEIQKQKGTSIFTITPEFGPSNYLPALPYTRQPVANQWDINVFMMELLKKRYQ
jgi:sugar phosphate isomerase/epimerase